MTARTLIRTSLAVVAVTLVVAAGARLNAAEGRPSAAVKTACGSCADPQISSAAEAKDAVKVCGEPGKAAKSCGQTPSRRVGGCPGEGKKAQAEACASACKDRHAKMKGKIVAVRAAIDAATQAMEADQKDVALAELAKAKALLTPACRNAETVGRKCAPNKPCASTEKEAATFINGKCPIMGSTIDPAKVPATLTREFNDKTVAFCCKGCPQMWDKLSDEQKTAKLAATAAR